MIPPELFSLYKIIRFRCLSKLQKNVNHLHFLNNRKTIEVKGAMKMKKAEYDVLGMHCVSCSTAISKLLSKTKGVSDVEVILSESKILIEYDEKMVNDQKIVEHVSRLGYRAVEHKE